MISKLPPNTKERLALLERARQLYLFGDPGEKPVKNPEVIAEMTGLTRSIVVTHIGIWSTELVAMAQSCHRSFATGTNPEILESNDDDIVFLRETMDSIKEAARKIPDVKDGNRITLMAQFHTLSERWRKLTGVTAAMEISNEAVKIAAEAAIKGTIKTHGSGDRGRKPTSKVFDDSVDPNEETETKPTDEDEID